jgi:predicted NAD/FAD-binding protein
MKIAVVGAGVSGLVTAYLLSRQHEVTLYEAGSYLGGHTHTVPVVLDGRSYAIDTGFVVFNDRTYPGFIRLLERLGVASQPTTMSFSVTCEESGLEYNGTSLNRLFAQRRNLLRPSFHRMVRDILRFNRRGPEESARMNGSSVGEFLAAHDYGDEFARHYFVPMGAAIWSCPPRAFLAFPVRFVMEFLANHGLLQVHGRPTWRVVRQGSAQYVEALTQSFRNGSGGRSAVTVHLDTPVSAVRRLATGVLVTTRTSAVAFDEAVLACHSDQALAMVCDPDEVERGLLRAFPYQENEGVLHTDARALPATRRAWAAWNYRVPAASQAAVSVTYNMNILQRLQATRQFCVSLNPNGSLDPASVLERFTYHHPLFTSARDAAQARHGEVIRRRGLSFCGAYWGYGFHEDGVNSALAVARAFGEAL